VKAVENFTRRELDAQRVLALHSCTKIVIFRFEQVHLIDVVVDSRTDGKPCRTPNWTCLRASVILLRICGADGARADLQRLLVKIRVLGQFLDLKNDCNRIASHKVIGPRRTGLRDRFKCEAILGQEIFEFSF
jgi:hypothetical protein